MFYVFANLQSTVTLLGLFLFRVKIVQQQERSEISGRG